MEDLFRAIPAILTEFDDNEFVREAVVFAAWRRAAGETLREQAVPVELIQDRLVIAVASKMWKRHLEDLSRQMIFKLNAVLGSAQVRFIEFQVDGAKVENERRAAAEKNTFIRTRNVSDEITPELRRAADAIRDDKMREIFLEAAGGCLARKRSLEK
jgi:hypothetical protein